MRYWTRLCTLSVPLYYPRTMHSFLKRTELEINFRSYFLWTIHSALCVFQVLMIFMRDSFSFVTSFTYTCTNAIDVSTVFFCIHSCLRAVLSATWFIIIFLSQTNPSFAIIHRVFFNIHIAWFWIFFFLNFTLYFSVRRLAMVTLVKKRFYES